MDAETRAYIDEAFAALIAHIDRRFDAVERRFEAVDQRLDAADERLDSLERRLEERLIGIDERFRSLELRIELFETRVTDRLDALEARTRGVEQSLQSLRSEIARDVDGLRARTEAGLAEMRTAVDGQSERIDRVDKRLGGLDEAVVGVHTRFDGLSDDMRQRFRVLNDRVGGIEKRLVA